MEDEDKGKDGEGTGWIRKGMEKEGDGEGREWGGLGEGGQVVVNYG